MTNSNVNDQHQTDWHLQATTGSDDPNSSWNQIQVLTVIGLIIGGILIVGGMWWLWRRCQLPSMSSLQQREQFQVVPTMVPSPTDRALMATTLGLSSSSSISMALLQSPVPQSMTTTTTTASDDGAPLAAIIMPTKAPVAVPFTNMNSKDVIVTITPSSDGTSIITTITLNGEDGTANGGGCGCGCDRGPCTCGDTCVSEATMPPRYIDDCITTNTSCYTNNNEMKWTTISMVPPIGTFVDAGEYKGIIPTVEVSAGSPTEQLPSTTTAATSVVIASRAQMVWNVSSSSIEASSLERLLFCRC